MSSAVGGGGRAVWWALLALILARAVTAFLPSMWAWGVNVQRFLAPAAAWLPWLICAVLLVRPAAEAATPVLDRLGARLARGVLSTWVFAAALALLVWWLPDRTWFTGDFMLRQGVSETTAVPASFIQALPLERFLDGTVPRWFESSPLEPNTGARLIGALAAMALAAAAAGLARAWGLGGQAALVAAVTVCMGGCLVGFTGLAKPSAVMCALTAIAMLGATRLASEAKGGAMLGSALALALFTHRGALALLPAWALALAMARRAPHPDADRRGWWLALALPVAALAIALPQVVRIAREWDVPHHLVPAGSGALAAALAPLHLADLANLAVFYCPALPAALCLAPRGARAAPAADRWLPLTLVLTFLPALLFLHPTQGIPRDLDDFAPAGVALSILCARTLGRSLAEGRIAGWLAAPLVAVVATASLQWLLHMHDPTLGYARARALAIEAPARSGAERARLWDALAYHAFREQRWDAAVEASGWSVRYAPHPRALAMLAIARTYTGDHLGAESLYVSLTEKTPDDPLAWLGLGGAALRVGDSLAFARARSRLEAYPPDGREARLIRRHLRMFPQVWPTTGEIRGGEAPPGGR